GFAPEGGPGGGGPAPAAVPAVPALALRRCVRELTPPSQASLFSYIMIPLAYSDRRFGGQSPPRCIWFCTWFGRLCRPNQVQNRNVSRAAGPPTSSWRVCQQYHI